MPSRWISSCDAKAAADDADRPEQRGFLAKDLVAGERQPIAARGRDILGKGDDRNLFLLGELADAAIEQRRLHRRAARRIDDDCHGDQPGQPKRALDRRGMARQRDRVAACARQDHALKAQHRNDRPAPPQPLDIEIIANSHDSVDGASGRH